MWQRRLADDAPYRLRCRLALEGEAIVGGIIYEQYPRSRCGLVTYMVVDPSRRGQGLGERLQRDAVAALQAAGAPAVFGEVNDPRKATHEPEAIAWQRLARNLRWGARIAQLRYIQPALGEGLARDRDLLLIALAAPATLPGTLVRDFVAELHAITEGREPDAEIVAMLAAIPETVTFGSEGIP